MVEELREHLAEIRGTLIGIYIILLLQFIITFISAIAFFATR